MVRFFEIRDTTGQRVYINALRVKSVAIDENSGTVTIRSGGDKYQTKEQVGDVLRKIRAAYKGE